MVIRGFDRFMTVRHLGHVKRGVSLGGWAPLFGCVRRTVNEPEWRLRGRGIVEVGRTRCLLVGVFAGRRRRWSRHRKRSYDVRFPWLPSSASLVETCGDDAMA